MASDWLKSNTVGPFLSNGKNSDIRVAVNDALVEIEDVFYDEEHNCHVIELDSEALAAAIGLPELWSTGDAATFLGVSRQRVDQIWRSRPDDLEPLMRVGPQNTCIWLADTWRRFATKKRETGRPRND